MRWLRRIRSDLKAGWQLSDAQETPWRGVKSLEAGLRDTHELAQLNACLFVPRDDIRLHDYRHIRFEPHVRDRPGRAAFCSQHGRPIPAAETVNDVIIY
jgi:hypothetical protein